jgi:xylan 1,4-beta-xylosidase
MMTTSRTLLAWLLPLVALCGGFFLMSARLSSIAASGPPSMPVTIRVDASQSMGAWRPVWRFFGADEPNYAYMKNGSKLLGELGKLGSQPTYFRAHNLLTTGDGTPALKWGSTNAYTEDDQGRPVHDWTIVDRIFDTYLASGVKPYVEVGFMPKALSVKPDPYQHQWTPKASYDKVYTGWSYPPIDGAKWAELVYQWASHCVRKYGRAEVERWYWQVWNEPNIGYWHGTPDQFFQLHDVAIDAIRRALPTARVGGADTAGSGGKFTREFLEHCLRGTNHATGQIGTPIDFISFHAKGAPSFVDGHVRMGISNQLRTVQDGFRIVASFPELKGKPIVIGESDPDGCAACQGPQLGYRNGTMYSSYTATTLLRIHDLADKHGVNLEGVLTWAFEFEDQPFFAGFRVLATNGIDLPVLNVFRMLGKMSGRRIAAVSSGQVPLDAIVKAGVRDKPDVAALASLDGHQVSVLVWNYHDDDLAGPDAHVELDFASLPLADGVANLKHYRIDREHGNSFEVWKRLGSPQQPTPAQYSQIEKAGQLELINPPETIRIVDSKATIHITLPRQAVSLLVLDRE